MDLNQDVVLGIMVGLVVWYIVFKLYALREIGWHRQDAIDRSKSVVLGHATENIAPLLPSFPYHHKDCVFLGKGVDYVVFDWLYEWSLKEIIFLEIKTWWSRLNRNEKMIRDIVERWRISYDLIRL